jgi:hypothetical protein
LASSAAGACAGVRRGRFVNEFDAGTLERLAQNNQGCSSRFGYTRFYLSNSHHTDPGLTSEILLPL